MGQVKHQIASILITIGCRIYQRSECGIKKMIDMSKASNDTHTHILQTTWLLNSPYKSLQVRVNS